MKEVVIEVDRIKQDYSVTWKFTNFYSASLSVHCVDALKIIAGLSRSHRIRREKEVTYSSACAKQIWIIQISRNDVSPTRHRHDVNLPALAARGTRKACLIFLPMRQE